MKTLIASWEQEVKQSRIVALPEDDAYLQEVGVKVWDVLRHLANGLGEQSLRQTYPSLTQGDVRACELFGYLRAVRRL
ncbi:DUF433 domain-containing protein [Spirosoma utsteinense]|uniref:DUF433 domain-containing protein n=1 Tax=Spirosoma utsteinense TaxID=2585773 RepID=A0ABR6W2F0_9BACT|nr:DUF433 domain-containing protein [Spirosoma utsteinense]MBC3783779.1 hypothetical protein [Spirosoma utsteinense]MBC3790077.1 hypothetical protein [Spirosoma utsteinense]